MNDLSEIKASPVDLTIIIGNLLDNAIEACEKLPADHRWITVKVIRDANASPTSIFLSIENSSLPVAIVNDHIATTKQEPELHGFGLRNVMETLHKYDAFHLNAILRQELQPPSSGSHFEHDALTDSGAPVLFSYLPDIPRLFRFISAINFLKYSGIIVCFDFQTDVLRPLCGDSIELQIINFREFQETFNL